MFIYQPPESDRKVRTTQGRPMTRRVNETIEHVTRGWIPVNPQILKEVQEKLGSGEYRKEPAQLVEDLKRDPGLFMHAARSLKQQVEDVHAGIDPLDALSSLEGWHTDSTDEYVGTGRYTANANGIYNCY